MQDLQTLLNLAFGFRHMPRIPLNGCHFLPLSKRSFLDKVDKLDQISSFLANSPRLILNIEKADENQSLVLEKPDRKKHYLQIRQFHRD